MAGAKQVNKRRRLRFDNFEDALRDAGGLAAAERQGTLRGTGTWSLGKTLGHLAFWASAPFDGYPDIPKPPWAIRKLIGLMRKRVIHKAMPTGIRMRGVEQGTFGLDEAPTEQALGRLRGAYNRLVAQTPTTPNPMFGEMTHEEWIGLNLRHAELHLSFFHLQ